MIAAPILILSVYLIVVSFGLWLLYTLVMAVVRISHAMERASVSVAEMARNQAARTGAKIDEWREN
jgi:hypothetical protein